MERTMQMYEGVCKYCGTIQLVLAMDQIDADEKISECCQCDGAEVEKKRIQLLENLNLTIGDGCVEQGFKRVSNEQETLITEMALAVLFGKLDKAVCQIGSTVITISTTSEKVKVKRVEKKAMALEG